MAVSKFDRFFVEKPATVELPERNETRKVGRPMGKKSDPSFKQYSALLKRATHSQVMGRLIEKFPDPDQRPDFSDIVQQQLEAWLERNP